MQVGEIIKHTRDAIQIHDFLNFLARNYCDRTLKCQLSFLKILIKLYYTCIHTYMFICVCIHTYIFRYIHG